MNLKKLLAGFISVIMAATTSISVFAVDSTKELSFEEANQKIQQIVYNLNDKYDQSFEVVLKKDLGRNYTIEDLHRIESELRSSAEAELRRQNEQEELGEWQNVDDSIPYGRFDVVKTVSKIKTFQDGNTAYFHLKNKVTFYLNNEVDNDPNEYIQKATNISITGVGDDTWVPSGNIQITTSSPKKLVLRQKGTAWHYSDLYEAHYTFTPSFSWTMSEIKKMKNER